jgi:hypothetical protein
MTIVLRTSQPQSICQVAPIASRAYGFLLGVSDYDIFGTGTKITYTGTSLDTGLTGVTRKFIAASSENGVVTTPSWVDPAKPWAATFVFRCDTIGTAQRIAVWSVGTTCVVIMFGSAGKLELLSGATGTTVSPRKLAANAQVNGKTYKACVGYDGAAWFMYIDGIEASGTVSGTASISTTPTNTYIGSRENATSYFTGNISLFTYIQGTVDPVSLSANPWQLFALQRNLISYANVSLPTLGRPAADISSGAWTSTAGTLSAAVNESVASDADFISVASGSTCEMVLDNTAFPGGTSQTLSYRASSTNASTLTVILKQGVTIIMTRTHALTPTITLYTQTLTSGEIATIIAGAISVTLTSS